MIHEPLESKSCCDCGLFIPFAHFKAINPSLSSQGAKGLYENPLIEIYCPNCYFQRPEKPYKKKRRSYHYKIS